MSPKEQVEIEEGKSYASVDELDRLEREYNDDEVEAMSKFYEDTLVDFKAGQVVLGKILAIGEKEVSVDIGFKSEGNVLVEEFDHIKDVKVGDNVEVLIDEIEDADGFLVLSKKKADFMRTWDKVIESYESGEVLTGQCVRRIKGGIVVDLGGVDAFLPGSQIDVRPIRDFDALIGHDMEFKIVKVNHLRKNIVVSHRVLVEQEMKGQREKILADLQRGQVLEGIVKNITDFGVFIDLGGVDGLLHINDLSWGRVSHPSEVVALDEKINVVVLDYNEDKDRISLGLKQLQPHPWEDVESKYPVDSVIRGKVVSLSDYGAFVELEKGVEGLIHISEMSWTQHIKHPSKILAVGEMVDAKVLNIQKEERKISLGLKQLDPDPWDTLAERYPIGSRHNGIVRNLTNFGAFVELEEGIDGLIHISDLSWTKKIRHPGEVVKKGDEIEVIVLNVDRANRRISLGYKQTQDNPWDTFENVYKNGTQVEGKVVRLIEKGLLAELPDGVDGFVPMSQLAKDNISKPADHYQIDDVLQLTVIEFNKENKKIVLSERQVSNLEEAKVSVEAEVAESEEEISLETAKSTAKHKTKEARTKTADVKETPAETAPEAKGASEGAEGVAEKADQVVEAAEPTAEQSEPATAEAATEGAEGVAEEADHVVDSAEPAAEQSEPATAEAEESADAQDEAPAPKAKAKKNKKE
ncbi:30S ribosomal protein S1 [candidate division KSB1 bacterium]|nr:30S ribosomal protein S1 [candidate division KSB1 bacterium]RQW09467.1 MAG: 30S ribosomal protein S1 [candidate division KSB1 bacterium]